MSYNYQPSRSQRRQDKHWNSTSGKAGGKRTQYKGSMSMGGPIMKFIGILVILGMLATGVFLVIGSSQSVTAVPPSPTVTTDPSIPSSQ